VTQYEDVNDGDTTWRFETGFLQSNWTCIWGRGCKGIEATVDTEKQHGCCSLGAELDGVEEAMDLAAHAALLSPEHFQFHAHAAELGIFKDSSNSATRVVDGACIFLNRPGFAGGSGCALHIKVDWELQPDNTEIATVRRWSRADWGEHGKTMAWVCTDGDEAYVGDTPVIESLQDELTALVGNDVYVQIRQKLQPE
jgi:hypothetical protein